MHKGCRFTEAPVGTGYLCKLLRTTRLVRVNKKKQKRWKKKKKRHLLQVLMQFVMVGGRET